MTLLWTARYASILRATLDAIHLYHVVSFTRGARAYLPAGTRIGLTCQAASQRGSQVKPDPKRGKRLCPPHAASR